MARPNLSYLKNLILFLLGLPLGMLTGLTAIAGSVFTVPIVRSLLGLRPARAVGVGLAVTFFAALASFVSYAQHGFILVGLAVVLAVCQVVGAAWGERVAARMPALDRLPWLWGILVITGGAGMLAQGLGQFGGAVPWHANFSSHPWFYPEAMLIAVAVGLISRILGLGGVLMVPAAIYGLGIPPHTAQGTVIVVLALASLPGMLIYARRGAVEAQAATWLSVGSVFGGLSGALWAVTRFTDRGAIILFGLMVVISGLMLLWRKEADANPEVEKTVAEPVPLTVADPPLVSPVATQENTNRTKSAVSEPPVNAAGEDKEENSEAAQAGLKPEATPQALASQHRIAKDVLEQKLKNLEKIVASETPEPKGDANGPLTGDTTIGSDN